MSELVESRLDYWALGHIHESIVPRPSDPFIGYPGHTQGRHINEAGPRGCFLVRVTSEGLLDGAPEFVATDSVRWLSGEVEITGLETMDGLLARIEDRIRELADRAEGRSVVARITLRGRGRLHAALTRPNARRDLLDELHTFGTARNPFVWVEKLVPRTRPERNLDARRGGFPRRRAGVDRRYSPIARGDGGASRRIDRPLRTRTRRQVPDSAHPRRPPNDDRRCRESLRRFVVGGRRLMRIEEFHVEGFGRLANVSMTDVPSGLSIVLGENEAGKTTLLEFFRSILFGLPARKQRDFYPPLNGGRKGGRVVLENEKGERIIVERFEGKGTGPLTVTLPDGSQGGEAAFRELIGSATDELYGNVFAFRLTELQSFESLDTDKVRDAIYSAGIGIGRRTIAQVVQELARQRDELFVPGGSKPAMNQLLNRLEDHGRRWN
ncbi:MAG: hypothetical protein FJ297_12235 [Planctomycetes bacterium]|nr:hypothetical protein [Planctomycetota bacterium]